MANVALRHRLTQRTLLQSISWIEGKLTPQPNPTVMEIASQHSVRLRKAFLANKNAGGAPDLVTAIHRARQCRDSHPCGGGACPTCEAYAQRAIVCGLEKAFARVRQGRLSLTMLTVVSTSGQCARDALNHNGALGGLAANLRLKRMLISILRRACIEVAIAGFDITLNVDQRGNGEPFPDHWQLHANLIVRTSDLDQLLPLLKKAFPKVDGIPKPIDKRQLDGKLAAAAYLYKRLTDPSALTRRVTIAPSPKQTAGSSNTRLKRLHREEWQVLLRFLDQLGLEGRLVLLGPWQQLPIQTDGVEPIFSDFARIEGKAPMDT